MEINYKDFIKRYTTINKDFLDDFLNLYNPESLSTDFIINLETVAKWLDSEKYHLKDTLKNTYEENIDYKVIKPPNNKGSGGKSKELVLLTTECFKTLCMMSKTEKAKYVRKYFIEIENLMIKYRIDINKALETKIKKLENNNKKIENVNKGMIYVFKTADSSDDNPSYKIGKTKNLYKRTKIYNTGQENNIDIIKMYETDNLNEIDKCAKLFLDRFRYRKSKEVYKTDINMINKVIKECVKLSNLKLKYNNKEKITDDNIFLYIDKN